MIIFNKNDMMISKGDTIDKYFYLPNYTSQSGDAFNFYVRKLNEQGNLQDVVLNQAMSVVTADGQCYVRLQVTATQTKALNAGEYSYDILYSNGAYRQTLLYPAKFIVREVVNNG